MYSRSERTVILIDLPCKYSSAAISRFRGREAYFAPAKSPRVCTAAYAKDYSTHTLDICFSAFVAEAATSAK